MPDLGKLLDVRLVSMGKVRSGCRHKGRHGSGTDRDKTSLSNPSHVLGRCTTPGLAELAEPAWLPGSQARMTNPEE